MDHLGIGDFIEVADEFHFDDFSVRGLKGKILIARIPFFFQFQEFLLVPDDVLQKTEIPDRFSHEQLVRIPQKIDEEWIDVNYHAGFSIEDENAFLRRLEKAAVSRL